MLKMNLTFNTLQQFLACTKNKDSFQPKKKREHQSADINCLDVCSFCVVTIVLALITHSSGYNCFGLDHSFEFFAN